jgi:hypothetical protein
VLEPVANLHGLSLMRTATEHLWWPQFWGDEKELPNETSEDAVLYQNLLIKISMDRFLAQPCCFSRCALQKARLQQEGTKMLQQTQQISPGQLLNNQDTFRLTYTSVQVLQACSSGKHATSHASK